MQRRHEMPFGAQVLGDGTVRFQLWAPKAESIEVCLDKNDRQILLPLDRDSEGWYRLETDHARPGDLYQYLINGSQKVPDPASRFQPQGVHGPSQVIDPCAWDWQDDAWQGRPWREAVVYELHVGSFTPEGTFAGVVDKLEYLARLGVTAIELMPIASFPGARNWGYDGVLPFAPDSSYGPPEELKRLVQEAHGQGLLVFLDVVYNHFGPEGNYLHLYAPDFFTGRYQTPWGDAVNFDGNNSHWVRRFFIENACFWLEEYNFDGLRLDAVHAVYDKSKPDILVELAEEARYSSAGKSRPLHLVLENDNNEAWYLRAGEVRDSLLYNAQWNDDMHHALHVLITGETNGYYMDYADKPIRHLGRCLSEGFSYQGEVSAFRQGKARGETSKDLPPTAFVAFLQNHDQIGNRAFGERINALASEPAIAAATVILLLAPSPPLLFMGQEWGAAQPFPFFGDFGSDLAPLVTEGRRREFAHFPELSDPGDRKRIPDPNSRETFLSAVLDWEFVNQPQSQRWLAMHRDLLKKRHQEIIPLLAGIKPNAHGYSLLGEHALRMEWLLADGGSLTVLANLGGEDCPKIKKPPGRLIYGWPNGFERALNNGVLPAWSAAWYISPGEQERKDGHES